jgi:hypothetical protein
MLEHQSALLPPECLLENFPLAVHCNLKIIFLQQRKYTIKVAAYNPYDPVRFVGLIKRGQPTMNTKKQEGNEQQETPRKLTSVEPEESRPPSNHSFSIHNGSFFRPITFSLYNTCEGISVTLQGTLYTLSAHVVVQVDLLSSVMRSSGHSYLRSPLLRAALVTSLCSSSRPLRASPTEGAPVLLQ